MDGRIAGIIGGMGPYADIDVITKIRRLTEARKDQEHISLVLISYPGKIPDRSEFLWGKTRTNPAEGMLEAAKAAVMAGADVLAITCATAHSPKILNRFFELAKENNIKFEFVHLIKSAGEYIAEKYPFKKVGILSTYGAYLGGAYEALKEYGIKYIFPDEDVIRNLVHPAIYHPTYGIKASPMKISDFAHKNLILAIQNLIEKGSEIVLLGCTELPLAIKMKEFDNVPVVDINEVLARKILERCRL